MSRRLVENHTTSLTLLSSLLFLFTITLISAEGFSISTFSSHPARPFGHKQRRQRRRQNSNCLSTIMHPPSRLVIPSCMDHVEPATILRGGGTTSTQLLFAADPSESSKCPVSKSMAIFGTLWGSLGVVYILTKAIKRVLPIALEPLTGGLVLSPVQWIAYAMSCAFFAYAEGYKGFQLKFSPLVVKRSLSLVIGTRQGTVLNYILAPLYSMGLIHATKKRMIVSWSVTTGVAAIVVLVKKLNPIARCIVDAGVVVGLTWGSLSIVAILFESIRTGRPPSVDACLPDISSTMSTKKD